MIAWGIGDRLRKTSPLHGQMSGVIVRVVRWRHKMWYHVDWQTERSGLLRTRELAGRDDGDWSAADEMLEGERG